MSQALLDIMEPEINKIKETVKEEVTKEVTRQSIRNTIMALKDCGYTDMARDTRRSCITSAIKNRHF